MWYMYSRELPTTSVLELQTPAITPGFLWDHAVCVCEHAHAHILGAHACGNQKRTLYVLLHHFPPIPLGQNHLGHLTPGTHLPPPSSTGVIMAMPGFFMLWALGFLGLFV